VKTPDDASLQHSSAASTALPADAPTFYAPAMHPRGEFLNSPFHRRMVRIAFGERHGARRWYRSKTLDRYHRLKIGFVVAQKHFTSRLRNYLTFARQRMREARVGYLPPTLVLETGARCLLRCPGCLSGLDDRSARGRASAPFASLGTFKASLDATYDKCFQVAFFTHGEPLLNEAVFAASEYARGKGVWTFMHTNLMPRVSDLGERLVDAGLCNLVVSIDGATQEIYELYRRGGQLDLVLERIGRISEVKRRRKARFPWITAKFIIFEHNWHEIERFRERALRAGADEAVFVSGFANHITGTVGTDFEFDLDALQWRKRWFPERCPFLWTDLRVSADGGLYPCGGGSDESHLFDRSDAARVPMLDRYNGPRHLRMREFFLRGSGRSRPPELPEPCATCELVRRLSDARSAPGAHPGTGVKAAWSCKAR
jgi:MoaA/NifB/PqqE/SkfB family radical SAM enzyme